MWKTCIIATAVSLFMVSCTTITIKTVPDQATAHFNDGTSQPTPCDLNVPYFTSPCFTIRKRGFADQTVSLNTFPSGSLTVTLDPVISLDSVPDQATVFLNGRRLGTTPLKARIPAGQKAITILFRKKGFMDERVHLEETRQATDLKTTLIPDGPGRYVHNIMFTPQGFPRIRRLHDRELNLQAKATGNDRATLLMDFPHDLFPVQLNAIQDSPNLLVPILRYKTDSALKKPFANILFCDVENQSLTPFTAGHYFELSATIAQDVVFHASMQTGRCDLWSKRMDPKNPDATLVLSNKMVKYQLTAREGSILFTAFLPYQQEVPRIWIATIDGQYLTQIRELCSGEQPAWAAKGRNVAFQKKHHGTHTRNAWFTPTHIWKIKTDGSQQTQLTDRKDVTDKNPAWTADGNHIIFASNRNAKTPNNFNLWRMDADGKNLTQLTFSEATNDFPVLTQDGKAVLFRSNRNGSWGIWKLNLPQVTGTNQTESSRK